MESRFQGLNDVGVLFKLEHGTLFKKLRDFETRTGSHPVGTLAMERLEPRLSVEAPSDKIAYDVPFDLIVKIDHNMPVYIVSEDTTIVSVRNGRLYPKAPGETSVRVFALGDYSHMPADTKTYVRVRKRPQTITFDEVTSKTFGRNQTFDIFFNSSSGLPVTITSSNTSIATVSGNVVTIRGGGFVDLIATQLGDNTYGEAKRVVRTLEVAKADQTISFAQAGSILCCYPITLQATSTSGLPVAFKASDRSKLDINETSATPTGIGTVEIIAFQAGNPNYNAAEVRRTVTIIKGFSFVSFYVNGNTFTVGDSPYYTRPNTPAGPVTVTSNPAGIAEYNDGQIHFLSPGTTTITAKYPGNDRFYSSFASVTITVKARKPPGADNVISWPTTSQTRFLSEKSFNLVASTSSGLPVKYTSSDPNVLRIEGNQVSLLKAGTGSITAEQAGNDTLPAATSVTKTFTVQKAVQSVYISYSYVTASALPYNLPVTTDAGLPITYGITDSGIASLDNYYLTAKSTGTLVLTANQPGNDEYLPFSKSFPLQIYASNDNVFFSTIPKTLKVGDSPILLKGYSPRGLPVTFTSSKQTLAEIEGPELTPIGAGSVIITAQSKNGLAIAGGASQYLTIEKGDQIISMADISDKTFGDASFIIRPESSAKLPVKVSTTTPAVVNIVGDRVSIVGTGTAKIILSQPGDLNYNAAADHIDQFEVKDVAKEFDIIGTVSEGGPNGSGAVYAMNSSGSQFRYLKQFEPKTSPSPAAGFITGKDGYLYGNFRGAYNQGRIVRLNADGTSPVTVHAFNGREGAEPYGNLIQGTDDFLYGTTFSGGKSNGGIIFRVKPDGTAFTVIFEFSSLSGRSTKSGLIMASDGRLYGVTTYGGFGGYGTLFSIKTDGSEFTILQHFDPQTGYDATGELAQGPDGTLYGTLRAGALNNRGCVYRIKTNGNDFSTVLTFGLNPAGAFPAGGVQISDGVIYGVTGGGGDRELGTIYSVNPDGTNAKQLFSFDEQSGSYPASKLAVGSDGKLYGAGYLGGTSNAGTIFSIAKNGTGFTKLADLDGRARYYENGPLLEISPGLFLGGAARGGTFNSGALFTISTTKAFNIIDSFPQSEQTPRQLVADRKGEFYYGVTAAESWNQGGGIFRMSADGSDYQQIFKIPAGETVTTIFYCSTGHVWISGVKSDPISGEGSGAFLKRLKTDGSLIQDVPGYPTGTDFNSVVTLTETQNGFVYGLANSHTKAFVFRIKNDGTGYTVLQTMNENYPAGNILAASDGNLYFGSDEDGVFRINAAGQVSNIFKYPETIVRYQRVHKIIELNGGRLGIVTQGGGAESGKPGINGAILSFEKDGTGYAPIFFPTTGGGAVDMLQTMDGWIFVATQTGSGGNGSIYKIRADGSSYTPVRAFKGDDGANPVTFFFKKHQQTLSFDPLPEVTPSTPAFLPVASSSSGAVIKFTSSDANVAKIEDGRIVPLKKGTSTITATLPENANYHDGGSTARMLTVTSKTQTITFPELTEKRVIDSGFNIVATASSGLPLSFSSSDPSIASINGLRVIIHKVGSVTITAMQNGNDDFLPAENVSRRLVIVTATQQTISLTNPGVKVMGDEPFTIGASASSGLPVTLSSNSVNVSVSGNTVILLAPGSASILATQSGDENFDKADPVLITFCVNPQKPGIDSTGNYPDLILNSTNESGNAWYYNESESAISHDRELRPAQQGTYTVSTSVDGCTSETSDPYVLIATGIDIENLELEVFPNPVDDILNVTISGKFAVVEVANTIGDIVYRGNIFGDTLAIDVTSLPSGVYLIKLASDSGIVVKKIIKR